MQGQYAEKVRESERALVEQRTHEQRIAKLSKMFNNKDYLEDVLMLEKKKAAKQKTQRSKYFSSLIFPIPTSQFLSSSSPPLFLRC